MVDLALLRKGLRNPLRAMEYVARGVRTRVDHPRQTFMEGIDLADRVLRGNPGVDVMAADWDTLIVLDACRYDLFEAVNWIDGDLAAVRSKAGFTTDFLERNFGDSDFPDTVYVSANPMLVKIDAQFHDRIRLWEDSWSTEIDVVPPDAVAGRAVEAFERYPDKRLIVHFMQPHHPFIGELGRSLVAETEIEHYENGIVFWNQLRAVDAATRERFWAAYRENLELALPHVERLVDGVDGKTVVTSDHGNEFGRFGVYGHMRGATDGLRRVPWLEIDGSSRREIEPGSATEGPRREVTRDSDVAFNRLRQLGYVDA